MLRIITESEKLVEFPDWLEIVYDKGGWISFVHAIQWKYPELGLREIKEVLDQYRKLTGKGRD